MDIHQLLEQHPGRGRSYVGLDSEPQLRAAAETLIRASIDEITGITVVGIIGADDLASFEQFVVELADEFDLEPTTHFAIGSFSVRFSRRVPIQVAEPTESGVGSWLRRRLAHRRPEPMSRERTLRQADAVDLAEPAVRDS